VSLITHWIGGWVGTIAGLDAVMKRKIPSLCRDLNPRLSSPVSQRYTTEVSLFLSNGLGKAEFCILSPWKRMLLDPGLCSLFGSQIAVLDQLASMTLEPESKVQRKGGSQLVARISS
jgi:hypothetical protein